MRDEVEETKDLIAVHNLSEEKLLKNLKLGGLPMPSIAIVNTEHGHDKFSDISLVSHIHIRNRINKKPTHSRNTKLVK